MHVNSHGIAVLKRRLEDSSYVFVSAQSNIPINSLQKIVRGKSIYPITLEKLGKYLEIPQSKLISE